MTRPIQSDSLSARLTVREVLALAGYSRATLRARQKTGRMPWPIDRGGRGGIYQRDAVLSALGLMGEKAPEPGDAWAFKPDAYRAALDAEKAGAILQRKRLKPPRI